MFILMFVCSQTRWGVSQHALGQGCIPACTWAGVCGYGGLHPPSKTATEAVGTHPIGMHSWIFNSLPCSKSLNLKYTLGIFVFPFMFLRVGLVFALVISWNIFAVMVLHIYEFWPEPQIVVGIRWWDWTWLKVISTLIYNRSQTKFGAR